METGYSITLARPEHLRAPPEIERPAAILFRGWDVPHSVLEETTPLEEFWDAQEAGLLWVALSPQHHPVGFALVEREGLLLHLKEIDVHPQYGCRGVGAALVESVSAWARDCGGKPSPVRSALSGPSQRRDPSQQSMRSFEIIREAGIHLPYKLINPSH